MTDAADDHDPYDLDPYAQPPPRRRAWPLPGGGGAPAATVQFGLFRSLLARRLLYAVPAAAALIIALVIAAQPPAAWQTTYRAMAKETLEAGDYSKALVCVQRLLQLDPGNPELRYLLAGAYEAKGDQEAVEGLLASLAPRDQAGLSAAHEWQAERLLRREPITAAALGEAEAHLSRVDVDRRKSERVALRLAQVYLATGRLAEAEPYIGLLNLQKHPEVQLWHARALLARGEAAKAQEEARLAAVTLKTRAEAAPDNSDVRRQWAEALVIANDFPGAERVLRAGLVLGPPARYAPALAQLYVKWAEAASEHPERSAPPRALVEEAAVLLKQYSDKSLASSLLSAQIHLNLKNLDAALVDLLPAAKESADAELELARVYVAKGDRGKAAQAGRSALQRFALLVKESPDDPLTRIHAAQAAVLLDKYPEAIELLKEGFARTRLPVFRPWLAAVHVRWWDAQLAKRAAAPPEKFAILREALTYDPWNLEVLKRLQETTGEDANTAKRMLQTMLAQGEAPAAVHWMLGNNAWFRGDRALARSHLEQALRLAPNNPAVVNNLAWMLAQSNPPDYERALSLTSEALQKAPNHIELHDTRGRIYARLQQWQEALTDLEQVSFYKRDDEEFHRVLAEVYARLGMKEQAAEHQKLSQPVKKPSALETRPASPRK